MKRTTLSHAFGDVGKPSLPSEEMMTAVGNAFKMWGGLLSQRDFCAKKQSNKPHQTVTLNLTLDMSNLSTEQLKALKTLAALVEPADE